jgi:hypothetical protein
VTGTANGGNHGTKVDLQTQYQSVIAGLLTFYAATDTFLMKSGTYTRDQLIARIQSFVAALETTKGSYQQWRSDVQAERELEQAVAPLRAGVRGIVQTRFGKDGTQLLQFGFAPAKVATRTPATKVLAAAKGKATRALRGTKGSKQKSTVKATVMSVTVTGPAAETSSPTAPAAPSASNEPATPPAPAPAAAPAAPVAPVPPATPQH